MNNSRNIFARGLRRTFEASQPTKGHTIAGATAYLNIAFSLFETPPSDMIDNAIGIEGYFDAVFEREELHFREDVIRDAVESLVAFDDFDISGNGWELSHFEALCLTSAGVKKLLAAIEKGLE